MENIRDGINCNVTEYQVSKEDVIPLFLAGITIWRNIEEYKEDSSEEEDYTTLEEDDFEYFESYEEYCEHEEEKNYKNYISSLILLCDSDKFKIEINNNEKEIINKIKLILSQQIIK